MAERYIVGGFSFADEAEAEKAKKELEAIKYIKLKADMENPEMMLEVYHKILEENMFETPVGICFLKEIQEVLQTNLRTRAAQVEAIPAFSVVPEPAQKEETPVKNAAKESRTVLREKHINYKSRYRMLLSVSVVLLIIVVAMFGISMTTNSPNILNYENEIINKYENWEQELKEREQELKLREQELQNYSL